MHNTLKINIVALISMLLAACGIERAPQIEASDQYPPIYPDYIGVTIPAEIAPMNFNIIDIDGQETVYVEVTGSKGGSIEAGGKWANFDLDQWHSLLAQNRGGDLNFDVSVKADGQWQRFKPFAMHVSEHPLTDYGITYRRIAPGFETFSKIGIYQRSLSDFTESPILEETAVHGQCLNCHFANRGNPQQFSIHVRGANGGTIISKDGECQYLNTKTPETVGSCTYGYWHPGGRYCAYSLNRIYQNFYVGTGDLIEPWDQVSDIAVLDTETNQLILSPLLTTADYETTPAFSADGSTIYFCYAPKLSMPRDYQQLHYSLCSISFDAEKGQFGEEIVTVIDANDIGKSVSLARPSYDGCYLMYCLTNYGTTPVNHKDSDLWLMDLTTGKHRPLDEINSDKSDGYHNWSSDSRWFVFGSRRDDGLYSWPYFACIGDDGRATKPFVLPQRNPLKYYGDALQSFNVPDFTTEPVKLDQASTRQMVMSGNTQQVHL